MCKLAITTVFFKKENWGIIVSPRHQQPASLKARVNHGAFITELKILAPRALLNLYKHLGNFKNT